MFKCSVIVWEKQLIWGYLIFLAFFLSGTSGDPIPETEGTFQRRPPTCAALRRLLMTRSSQLFSLSAHKPEISMITSHWPCLITSSALLFLFSFLPSILPSSLPPSLLPPLFLSPSPKDMFYWLEREEGRGRETERYRCERATPVTSCLCTNEGLDPQPQYVPWLGIKPPPLAYGTVLL